ncbi:MAG: N-acetylneuraminate synthase [Bdellovibrionota bacterium]
MPKVLIIAEAGVNHNGNIEIAKKLIDVAADSGADFVKFQTFKAENLVTKDAVMAEYQVENTKKVESQFDMLKKLELSEQDFIGLKKYAESKQIKFFSTGFDLESLAFLESLNMGWWKIPSGEITNLPYLKFIGRLNENVIVSTGMATMEEIEDAVRVLAEQGTKKENITVLHCTTDYPAKMEDVNLRAMNSIAKKLNVKIGYSDHTLGLQVSLAAVALGAVIIEKHFTLDTNMEGPDHKASLTPSELKQMVTYIREIEASLGSDEKKPSARESENRKIARKSIVASQDIPKGTLLSESNLTAKRPGTGISPMKLDEIKGKKAIRDFKKDELIEI